MQKQADSHRKPREYEVGNWVWLKQIPFKQKTLAQSLKMKLAKRYHGPYEIIERVGCVAYRLRLPATTKIHPVFHVSKLKPFVGKPPDSPPDLPEVAFEEKAAPFLIVGKRTREVNGGTRLEVLVEWIGFPREDAVWIEWDELQTQYPSMDLEDKVLVIGGSIDTSGPSTQGPIASDSLAADQLRQEQSRVRERRPPCWAVDFDMGQRQHLHRRNNC